MSVLLLHSVLEVSTKTEYNDAMSPWTTWIRVLPLTAGILTGCTTLVTTYDRVRARLTEPEVDETIHRGGAWFLTPSKGYTELQGMPSWRAHSYYECSRIGPYEPNQIPPLMVRGRQSSSVVFSALADFLSEHWEGCEEVDESRASGVSAILR
jgi:hypothetical protein